MTNYEIHACSELENKLKKIKYNSTFDYIMGLEAELKSSLVEIEKLKMALDKACDSLHELGSVILGGKDNTWSKEQWKEWLMKDE